MMAEIEQVVAVVLQSDGGCRCENGDETKMLKFKVQVNHFSERAKNPCVIKGIVVRVAQI